MRAAVFHGRRDVRIEEVPDPGAPAGSEVVLDVVRAAICGTDAAEFDRGPEMVPFEKRHFGSGRVGPMVLGHEFVGIVRQVGDEVEGLAVGDRVVPGATDWCGECAWCLQGRTNLCEKRYLVGMHRDGGLADSVAVPAKMCLPVPAECSDDAAAIAQPLAVALHGIERARIESESVVVIGAGGIGSFVVAGIAARNPEVLIVTDLSDARLRNAEELGATHTFRADDPNLRESILELTGGVGPAVVVEASGAPSAPAFGTELLPPGGRLLLMGLQEAPRELDLFEMTLIEIDLITSNAHVCDRNLQPALDLLSSTDLAETVIGDRIGLGDLVEKGFAPLIDGSAGGKIVVEVDR